MIKLPTTFVEADALMFARGWIAGFARGNPWSGDSALSADASRALLRHMAQSALQFTPIRMHIIEAAKATGDPDAIEVLRALLLECKAKRVDMPSDLIAYDMHVTAHGEPHHQRPGRKKKNAVLRDLCICQTVAAVCDRYGAHGITATGRSPRRPPSGCAIVAEALRLEAHLNIDYDAVKKIWGHYGRAMPTVAGWASK